MDNASILSSNFQIDVFIRLNEIKENNKLYFGDNRTSWNSMIPAWFDEILLVGLNKIVFYLNNCHYLNITIIFFNLKAKEWKWTRIYYKNKALVNCTFAQYPRENDQP